MMAIQKPEGDQYTDRELKSIEIYLEFQWKALVETAKFLAKGTAFYLAVMAAVSGYVFTQNIEIEIQKQLLFIAILVSFLFSIAVCSIGWGCYTGLKDLEYSLHEFNSDIFLNSNSKVFFKRARFVFWLIIGCFILIEIVILFGLFLYLQQ